MPDGYRACKNSDEISRSNGVSFHIGMLLIPSWRKHLPHIPWGNLGREAILLEESWTLHMFAFIASHAEEGLPTLKLEVLEGRATPIAISTPNLGHIVLSKCSL